jgi:hypothetical protein
LGFFAELMGIWDFIADGGNKKGAQSSAFLHGWSAAG